MAGLLPLLFPLLLAVSASAQVFLSIDCGASAPYTDGDGIRWVGDGAYVSRGEAHTVRNTTAVAPELTTVRAFTSRKKNCYTIPVRGGSQILLRTSFYYGNYDGRASPPAFDVIFDGNMWWSVETTAGDVFSYEAIYVVSGEATSVCFGQSKPGQVPFVSAIEVRSLGVDMYPHFDSTRWLLMWQRVVYGATSDIRYPDDPYDRIWSAQGPGRGIVALRNETAIVVSDLDAADRPPAFRTAIGTNSTTATINLGTSLPTENTDININFYFAEMQQLGALDQRNVQVAIDGAVISQSIAVPAGNVLEYAIYDRTANANTSFDVQAASDSTLPPIVSAMEVFSVGDPMQATDNGDVEGLASLKRMWPVLNDWTGDPCLPAPYNWEWVGCNSDDTPRVTALNLGGFGLSGVIPELSDVVMTALETIDLHNNKLSGPIPRFFGSMPNLKVLNLADNNFNGTVPSSLSQNSRIKLDVSGNPNLQCSAGVSCSSGKKKKSSNVGLIVGIAVPLGVLFCAAVVFLVCLHQRRVAAVAAVAAPAGKPNAHAGAPSGPPSRPPPPAAPAAHGGAGAGGPPAATDDYRIAIEQQMGSELADLVAQQAQQQFETIRSPESAPESTLLRQQ
ncbi:hypothetical protein Taro_048913 [Colocasia esculenta]|uniref:Malectin-like domain-containing protein n=1 Tax=Colocasia esculenta TaxID=4460 RepID=A0A843X9H4_COLES|nr:hypothetical protein [Colocasia esculenta]